MEWLKSLLNTSSLSTRAPAPSMSSKDESEFALVEAARKYYNDVVRTKKADAYADMLVRGQLSRLGCFKKAYIETPTLRTLPIIYWPLPVPGAPWPWRIYRHIGKRLYKMEASNGVIVADNMQQDAINKLFDRARASARTRTP